MQPQELHTKGSTWSKNGVLGLGGNTARVNVGELEVLTIPDMVTTLTLGLRAIGSATAFSGSGHVIADVLCGRGTASYAFQMDFAQGASVTLPAGKVKVDAIQVGDIQFELALSIALSAGTRAGTIVGPKLTQYVNIPGGGPPAFAQLSVPARAIGLIVPRVINSGLMPVPVAPPPPPYFPRFLPSDVEGTVLDANINNMLFFQHLDAGDAAIWSTGMVLPSKSAILRLSSITGIPAGPGQPVIWLLDG